MSACVSAKLIHTLNLCLEGTAAAGSKRQPKRAEADRKGKAAEEVGCRRRGVLGGRTAILCLVDFALVVVVRDAVMGPRDRSLSLSRPRGWHERGA